ncbi:MAG: hypothetical protein HGB10_05190 [Coriobacteriia bacterium]|nr:hypothetical protein [Coriobacteriia bacterium]
MRVVLVVLLAASVAVVAGCGSGASTMPSQSQDSTQTQPSEQAQVDSPVAEKIADPITITPKPKPVPPSVAEGGISKVEAQALGGEMLVAHRKKTMGDAYGTSSEEYSLVNQVAFQGEWLLTYSRMTVNNEPSEAYAVTIAIDAKNGKQLRLTEAP